VERPCPLLVTAWHNTPVNNWLILVVNERTAAASALPSLL